MLTVPFTNQLSTRANCLLPSKSFTSHFIKWNFSLLTTISLFFLSKSVLSFFFVLYKSVGLLNVLRHKTVGPFMERSQRILPSFTRFLQREKTLELFVFVFKNICMTPSIILTLKTVLYFVESRIQNHLCVIQQLNEQKSLTDEKLHQMISYSYRHDINIQN